MFSISVIATSAPAVVYTAPRKTSFTRPDSHFTMAYVDGLTAWQIHGSNTNAYFFLKKLATTRIVSGLICLSWVNHPSKFS